VIVVLDSNVLLVSIPKKSSYRPIFDALLQKKFSIAISNEVLNEYIEVLTRYANGVVADNIAELLLVKENVIKTEIFFHWNLIQADPDDIKFVDLCISANADFIVTNDAHFDVLKNISFPRVKVLKVVEFQKLITV